MASSIQSWIQTTVINHDAKYGADLSQRLSSPVLCQLVQFTSFRTPSQPNTLITAIVSDKTHKVHVSFDKPATDSYERSKAGENPERLTGVLRSILRLKEYSLSIVPPSRGLFPKLSAAELPRIQLIVHRWDVVTGDRNDPEFFPRTKEVGHGKSQQDENIRSVLRKWWLGLSQKTHEEAPALKSEETEAESKPRVASPMKRSPSVAQSRASRPASTRSASVITAAPDRIYRDKLETVRRFVLDTAPGGKPLPAWLFMPPSAAQREALDKVQVFGVDMYADPPKDDEPSQEAEVEAEPASLPESNGHSNGSAQSNGHREYDFPEAQGRYSPSQVPPAVTAPRSPSPELPPRPRSHPGQPHIASPRPQTQAQGRFQTPYDSDDGEDEVPVRPAARTAHATQRPRRSFFASSPQRASSQPTGETDEEDLSDYERERRKARRSARAQADLSRGAEGQVQQDASAPSSLESQAAPVPAITGGVLLPATAAPSAPNRATRPHALVAETAAAPLPDSLPPPQSESLTKSQDSGSFDLSRYAAPSAQSAPLPPSSPIASGSHQISSSAPARPQHVLVPTTTDESGPLDQKDTGAADNSPALPAPAPAPTGPPTPAPAPQRKRPRSSNNTTASGDGDDEASLEKESQRRPRKRAATSNAGLGLGLPDTLTPASVGPGALRATQAVGVETEVEAEVRAEVGAAPGVSPARSKSGAVVEAAAEPDAEPEADADLPGPGALATPAKLSSWEPPAGQRTPPTAAKSTKRLLLVSEAAELVLPGYRPDLCDLPVPGLSTAWVESARAKAVEVREARERARRERRATTSGGGSGRRGR